MWRDESRPKIRSHPARQFENLKKEKEPKKTQRNFDFSPKYKRMNSIYNEQDEKNKKAWGWVWSVNCAAA